MKTRHSVFLTTVIFSLAIFPNKHQAKEYSWGPKGKVVDKPKNILSQIKWKVIDQPRDFMSNIKEMIKDKDEREEFLIKLRKEYYRIVYGKKECYKREYWNINKKYQSKSDIGLCKFRRQCERFKLPMKLILGGVMIKQLVTLIGNVKDSL